MSTPGGTNWRHANDDPLEGRRHRPDFSIVILSCLLVSVGLVVMYSISPALAAQKGEAANYYFSRHIIALAIGLVAAMIMYKMPLRLLKKAIMPLAIAATVVSFLTLISGGLSNRWLQVGGISFQSAELIKFSLIVWLGFFLSDARQNGNLLNSRATLRPIGFVLAAVAGVVVILQRDLGSMAVLVSIALAMLFVARVPLRPLLIGAGVVIVLGLLAVVSTPYRRDRLHTFLNPEADCQNAGYHACQALIAVGSGGIVGLGVGNSVQAYGYLPETPTDSIFAIYAEKFGFVGSVIMVGLLGILVLKLIVIAGRTQHWSPRLITIGIVTWIGFQAVINISAMLGMIPLKGITLPLVSYGGSSLIFVLMALAVALRISCYTSVRTIDLERTQGAYENRFERRGNGRTYNAARRSR